MNCKIIFTGIMYNLLNCTLVSAQSSSERENRNNLYMMMEFGRTNKGISAVQGGVSLQLENNYFKIKASSLIEPYEKDRRHKDDPVPGFSDLNFIIGKTYSFFNNQQFQVGTGLSLVNEVVQQRIDEPGYYTYHNKYKEHFTFGLPVELRYNFFINQGIALSLSGHGNANPFRSYCSASFGLMVGMF